MKQNQLAGQNRINYTGPFVTLVALFFFVGFLTSANGQFQVPLKESILRGAGDFKNTFATMITFAFFLAYPIFGPIGTRFVGDKGYKKTLVIALGILATGLVIFAASARVYILDKNLVVNIASAQIPVAFFILLLGSFTVGGALTILQVVINPYLTACHVRGTQAVQRLNIGGASNSIGTTLAPLFVAAVVFQGKVQENIEIKDLEIPILVLAAFIVLIAIVMNLLSLPDIEGTRSSTTDKLKKSVWSFSHLKYGVIGIFAYVGIEVCIGNNINLYVEELQKTNPDMTFLSVFSGKGLAATMATFYWGGMLVGRLISGTLSKIPPRTQLAVAALVAMVLVTISMVTNNPGMLVFVGLFHSVMWGAIFTLAIDQLGKYTSLGSGALMIGVLGGAVLPFLQGITADALDGHWNLTWIIVLLGEAYLLFYALKGSQVRTEQLEEA